MYTTINDMLKNLLQTPDNFLGLIRLCARLFIENCPLTESYRFSVSVPLMLMYGYRPESYDDPAIVAADHSTEEGFRLYLPGATLANLFPILLHVPSWFPGAEFKRKGNKVKALVEETKRIPREHVKKEFVRYVLRV